MIVRYMEEKDKSFIMNVNKDIKDINFKALLYTKSAYVMSLGDTPIGFMYHSVLWNSMPFMNLIYVKEEFRGLGYASWAIKFWEEDMKSRGYKMVLTSTRADEDAQHLYRKLGYVDCGSILFNDTPFNQPLEIIMRKVL